MKIWHEPSLFQDKGVNWILNRFKQRPALSLIYKMCYKINLLVEVLKAIQEIYGLTVCKKMFV